ncbi:MAG: hypothetical protein JXB35_08105 [Anaerolineae bacterium]|nr:hypothetical protein [Anaerolineae bacterium]
MKRLLGFLLPATLLLLAGCAPQSTTPVVNAGNNEDITSWFVDVAQAGGVWLSPATLEALGIDPQVGTLPDIRLSQSGEVAPMLPVATTEGWGIFFFASPAPARFSQITSVLLEIGKPGSTISDTVAIAGGGDPGVGRVQVRQEQNTRYLPQATADVPWFWQPIYAPGEIEQTIVLTDAIPGPVSVTVNLWSHTDFRPHPDHRLNLKWDGVTIGEWEWGGQQMQHLKATVDVANPEGEHTLTIETPSISESGVAIVWIDGWDIVYPRRVNQTETTYEATGSTLEVDTNGVWAFDVTAANRPLNLGAVESTLHTEADRRYWIGNPEMAAEPLRIRPRQTLTLPDLTGATYLVVAPDAFHTELQPLLDHREAEGLVTALVTPQAIYDTFGDGRPDPEAIRALVQRLPDLAYLLLVGDAVVEPGGYDDPATPHVVTPFTRTIILGETPAEGLLGADAENRAQVAVGRFPVSTPAEVKTLVEKTLAWETSGVAPIPLFFNDDEPRFASMVDEVMALAPGGETAQRIAASDPQSREQLLAALNLGPTWLNYNGHGSLTRLCDEEVLTVEDGNAWQDPSLVFAWTCLAAHFTHPRQVSMAEAWLTTPGGGAVAFVGPVGETTTFEQRPLVQAFYTALLETDRIGEAWLTALRAPDISHDVRWGFVILGDPALKLAGSPGG